MPPRAAKRSKQVGSDSEPEDTPPPVQTKKGRKSKASRARSESDEEPQNNGAPEGDDDGEIFDPATFTNQPLEAGFSVRKLEKFINDWATMDGQINKGFPMVTKVAVALEDTRADESGTLTRKMDEAFRQLLDAREELSIHKTVLHDLKTKVLQKDDITNSEEIYEKGLKISVNEYRNKTSRQKYGDDETYAKFRQEVWEATNTDAMPPLKRLIDAEDGDSNDDSDLEIGGATQSFICQLSLKPFKNPMTSRVCGHSFSQASINEFFKRDRKKCPQAGCNKMLSLGDFALDEQLARRTKAYERREKQREMEEAEEQDDEMVV